MAVGNPYGQGSYGAGPYATYGTDRPYGVGVYGNGPYGGWGANTFDVAGRASISWSLSADAHLTYQPGAISSVVWNVTAYDPTLEMHPWAISQIVFSVQGELHWSWTAPQPCETGTWTPAAPCESGVWQLPPGCASGSWTVTRFP